MDQEIEKIHSKINKLLRLKEGAEEIGSMEEAANAAAQIQKLLIKHNLDLNNISPEKQKDKLVIVKFKIDKRHGFSKVESDWMSTLLHVIAKHSMCKTIRMNKNTMYKEGFIDMHIIGEHFNIETVTYLFDQLVARIRQSRLQAYKYAKDIHSDLKKNAYYRSYSLAFTTAIASKLKTQEEEIKIEYSESTSLMVLNEDLLNEKAAQEYGLLTHAKPRSLKNFLGSIHGKRDGDKAQIHQGLGQSKKNIE